MTKAFMQHLCNWSTFRIATGGMVLIVLLGALDYLTGPELSFSIFYLLPVSMVAWFAGKNVGIWMSIACAVIWLGADVLAGRSYSHLAIPFWNVLVRVSFFLIVSFTLAALHDSRKKQERLAQFIVHDLRSPLTAVLAGFQLLEDCDLELDAETRQRIVQTGLSSGRQMLTLINSLLDLAQLEGGQMPLRAEPVSVGELLDASLVQVGLLAECKGIVLETQGHFELANVQADRELTTRILVNLLNNAVKFSPAGTCVKVRVVPEDEKLLAFRVSDQGPGIPGEYAERVFDKHLQVEAKETGTRIGNGLGLHFCRMAVEAQGGTIDVEDVWGEGTTIRFTLPLATC